MAVKKIVQIAVVHNDGGTQLHGLDEAGGLWLFNGNNWEFLVASPNP